MVPCRPKPRSTGNVQRSAAAKRHKRTRQKFGTNCLTLLVYGPQTRCARKASTDDCGRKPPEWRLTRVGQILKFIPPETNFDPDTVAILGMALDN
jgi:hypothetical protein